MVHKRLGGNKKTSRGQRYHIRRAPGGWVAMGSVGGFRPRIPQRWLQGGDLTEKVATFVRDHSVACDGSADGTKQFVAWGFLEIRFISSVPHLCPEIIRKGLGHMEPMLDYTGNFRVGLQTSTDWDGIFHFSDVFFRCFSDSKDSLFFCC